MNEWSRKCRTFRETTIPTAALLARYKTNRLRGSGASERCLRSGTVAGGVVVGPTLADGCPWRGPQRFGGCAKGRCRCSRSIARQSRGAPILRANINNGGWGAMAAAVQRVLQQWRCKCTTTEPNNNARRLGPLQSATSASSLLGSRARRESGAPQMITRCSGVASEPHVRPTCEAGGRF